ncbi:peptidyl-tRNA hydrolase [compost metagenome]
MAIEEKYKAEYDEWMTKHNNVVDADTTEADFQAMFMIERRSFPAEGSIRDNNCAACNSVFQHHVEDRKTTCRICVEAMQAGEKPKFNDAKQVILIRKDLAMPAGKLAAQVAHASMACLLNMGKWEEDEWGYQRFGITLLDDEKDQAVHDWMTKSFPKITLEVKNENQLKRYYDEAVAAGLPTSWIVDAGRTIFNGVPTPTCVGIGPASREQIDAITKRLRVYQ